MKFTVPHVQVTLRRYNKDPIWPNIQTIGNEFDGHLSVARKNMMQVRGHHPQVVDDDYRKAKVRRQTLQQADVGAQAAG